MPEPSTDRLLDDLDPAQREAVSITSGPLCILAGAGSGKTRVISRRVAYALATGVVRPRDVLVVTFTDKAAGEMRARLAALGQAGVTAATFHAAALRQLRHFWPRVHGGEAPHVAESKAPVLAPLAAGLPGGYRYLAVRDLAAEIEWAKARRLRPADYVAQATAQGRDGPLPADLMAGLFRRYQASLERAGLIDSRTCWHGRSSSSSQTVASRPRFATATAGSRSTSTRTRTRSRPRCSTPGSAAARTSPSSATRTRPSTPSPERAASTSPGLPPAIRMRGRSRLRPTTGRPRRSSAWPTGSSGPAGRRPANGSPARRRGPPSGCSPACRAGRPRRSPGTRPTRPRSPG
ncbi:MAG: UvrD-helicase domain-containing protein [Chloroflexi bacterium]|nr:UvrD-helicase domain-containing protein [Chloroflexota bacterium]